MELQSLFLVINLLLSTAAASSNPRPYEVIFNWNYFDFKFPYPGIREQMLKTGEYFPKNITMTGIKVHGPRMFLALPRARFGVPSTLNVVYFDDGAIPVGKSRGHVSPLLEPYPSWEMQKIGDCRAIQYAQSMEIDEFGRMWVFDLGRVNILAENPSEHGNYCPAKLLIFDLETNVIVAKHVFPPEVVSPTSNFLNDIVVGCEGGGWDKSKCWAYFSESNDVKLVVYSLEQNRSWFVRHNRSMTADPVATDFNILGRNYNFTLNIDGIALSPKAMLHDRVYFAPCSSYSIYSVSTDLLKSSKNGYSLKKTQVQTHTRTRSSQSDGMMMDSEGHLFYGAVQNNLVAYVNTKKLKGFKKEKVLIGRNDEELQWPDAFAFDNKGFLYVISIRLQRYLSNTIELSDVNYRVLRVFTGTRSYVYPSANRLLTYPKRHDKKAPSNTNAEVEIYINRYNSRDSGGGGERAATAAVAEGSPNLDVSKSSKKPAAAAGEEVKKGFNWSFPFYFPFGGLPPPSPSTPPILSPCYPFC